MVGGGIVDDHDVIILVVLHDDRLDIVDVAAVGCIIEGGNYHAERQFCVPTDLVLFLVVKILLVGELGVHEQVFILEVLPSSSLNDL